MPPKLRSIVFYCLLLLLLAVTSYLFIDFVGKSLPVLREYAAAQGDHSVMRAKKVPYFKAVEEAARVVPPLESVTIPSSLRAIERIAVAYALFPVKIKDDGNYLLDVNGSVRNVPSGWSARELSNGIMLYAKPGHGFLAFWQAGHSRWGEGVVLIFVLALMTFTGVNVLKALGIGAGLLGDFWFWGTGYLLGLVINGMIFWLILTAGIPLDFVVTAGTLSCLFIISLLAERATASKGALIDADVSATSSPPRSLASSVTTILAWAVITLALITAMAVPLTIWDELLIWVMKAKMLFYDGTLDFKSMPITHVYYPLVWPLHLHTFLKLAGGCTSELVKLVSASVFLAFVAQLHGACRVLGFQREQSWGLVGFYLILFVCLIFFTALPENIFYALSLGIAVFLTLWMRRREGRFLLLALILAAGLSGTKFEGGILVWAMAVSSAAAGRTAGMSLKDLSPLLWFLAAGAVPLVWIEWLKVHGYEYRIYHLDRPFAMENLRAVYAVVCDYWSQGRNLLLLGLLSAVYVFSPYRCTAGQGLRLFGWTALFLVCFSMGSVIFWPVDDIRRYYPEVLSRLFLRAAPFIILFWACKVFGCSGQDKPKAGA